MPRKFTNKPKTKAEDVHGGCNIVSGQQTDKHELVRLKIDFENTLKLNLAIQSCLHSLNTYNRARTEGKNMGMEIRINMIGNNVRIIECKIEKNN